MPPVVLHKQSLPWLGLWTVGGKNATPPGALRRARGIARNYEGPLRSRLGSSLLYSLDAHSLARYNSKRYVGSSTALYENGVSIKTGLDGTRLTFAKMPPTLAKQDYLFCAGGGELFKVSPSGVVSKWGIGTPGSGTIATDTGAGTLAAGTYQYYVVFKNATTGHRSNGQETASGVTTGANRTNTLTNIPVSSDTQVEQREIYRTVANGSQPFLLATIADNVTTSYVDDGSVALSSTQLATDNAAPDATFEDCVGPFDGRMWWCRNTNTGTQGRVYYSPIGRPESVEGFLEASNPDDATQKLVIWNGLWVITNRTIKQIVSTTSAPLETRRVPGTTQPHTAVATPVGILYESDEGVRLFNGIDAPLVSWGALGLLFQGVAAENLTAFSGVVAGYARDEYIIGDESQGLAYNIRQRTWRDLGLGIKAALYEDDTQSVMIAAGSEVLAFEAEGVRSDVATPIAVSWEFPSTLVHIAGEGLVERLLLDLNTNSQALTVTLILDGTETSWGSVSTASREVVELPVMRKARLLGVRLTGAVTSEVVLYEATADVYVPSTVQPV